MVTLNSFFGHKPTATLKVTDETNATDLKNFAAKAKNGEKIYGREVNGETVLYIAKSARHTGEWSDNFSIFKDHKGSRELAVEKLKTILVNTINSNINHDPEKADNNKSLDYYKCWLQPMLRVGVENKIEDESVLISSVGFKATVAESLATLVEKNVQRTQWLESQFAKYPEPKDIPPSSSKLLAETKRLGEHSYPAIDVKGTKFIPAKVVGSGSFGAAVRYRSEDGTQTKMVKFHKQFDQEKPEGLGKHLREAKHELDAGIKFSKGRDNVLGFTDHVRLPNRTMALIGDDGALGDVRSFGKKLTACHDHKTIGDHERRLITLTLTADMARGVASLQAGGAVHGDMKPANQVIDAEGRGNLIDLGFTEKGPKVSRIKFQHILSNEGYNAPEAHAMRLKPRPPLPDAANIRAEFEEIVDMACLNSDFDVTVDHLREQVGRLFQTAAYVDHADDYAVDRRIDMWGVGLTTFSLMNRGALPADQRLEIRAEEIFGPLDETVAAEDPKLVAAVKKAEKEIAAHKAEAATNPLSHGVHFGGKPLFERTGHVVGTGDVWIDRLLDGTLAANPDRRMTADEVQNHAVMDYASRKGHRAVGSDEVRALIKAIASGTAQEIDEARIALGKAFPEPEAADLQKQAFELMGPPPPYRASMAEISTTLPGPLPGPPPGEPPRTGPHPTVSELL
ncbi:MAG: hypothetical protein AAFN17_07440 [Pseudomonadota bacterium]